MRRVVVTGVGAVTPLGLTTESSFKNLISKKSG
jgi:3-oxoacyl-(acyl-carrier-protein) synthase